MICDSCLKTKNCKVPEKIRMTKTWCPQYVYSAAVERENNKKSK